MREVFEGDHSLNYGADDEHYIVYPKEKTLFEFAKQLNATAEQKEKGEDEKGEKHSSVCSYIDMIDDVSQKLKIGFEQYKKAKEEEIRKLKNELAAEKLFSDGVHKENQLLVQNLHKAKAENQKLSKKLDEARDEISCKDITIRRMKKDAERKDTAMQVDVSEVKEKFAREMIDSGIRFIKDMKTAIDDSQTFKCMGLLNHMTDDCFGKHEAIHRELKDMIQGIFGSREQVAKEQNEPRPNNVTVKEGGVYNGVVHHQNIHPKVDKRDSLPKADLSDFLPEVDMKDSLPRYKRRRFRLEGEDYEWK
uniref:hypothetical protein n=1 Tax=Segatella copri TaxID=165179 RepID=UPI003FF0EA6F